MAGIWDSFISGLVGLLSAFLIGYFTRRYSWYNTWYSNILTGAFSCAIIFAIILMLARLHG